MAKSDKDAKKSTKLDTKKQDDIKEKVYISRQVDTSIAILDSPENDVVLEALMFLSKYADIHLNNLNYLQQQGLWTRLVKLFDKNICILRLSLRLLGVLLTIEDVLFEIDEPSNDEKILEISNLYISHNDAYVKEYSVQVLARLASSCRVSCLIFNIDLFNPIFTTVKTTKNVGLLAKTLEFFYILLNAPAAISILPDIENFDILIFLPHLNHPEMEIAMQVYEILRKLTSFSIEVFQKMFRQGRLVEKMFDVIVNPEKYEFHQIAFEIVKNCMKSEETSSYFIESYEFLKFSKWVKTCDQDYLPSAVIIFENLTKIPSIRQVLFDLSIEDSILFFLRSTEKGVLNGTCKAISNMTTHRYCCERMLTPTVLLELLQMLQREDVEDPQNEIALKTIFDFSRRTIRTIDMLSDAGAQGILLEYFRKGINGLLTEDCFMSVLEILYKVALHPSYQKTVISDGFFSELLKLFQKSSDRISNFCCEIMTNFVQCKPFIKVFLQEKGPFIFVEKLKTTTSPSLLKSILIFIHSNLVEEKKLLAFLENNLMSALRNLPDLVKYQSPIIGKLFKLIYNIHLPLKLFETNRLDITDKLGNRFYLINEPWKFCFPFLEILEAQNVSTISTIYVVDYTFEVEKPHGLDSESELMSTSFSTTNSSSFSTIPSSRHGSLKSNASLASSVSPFDVHYGRLSPDPFLPKFIYHVNKYLAVEYTLENKIKILAEYVDILLCGPKEELSITQKIHTFKLHIECLKQKLGVNMIPIGFLRIGFHCERALLFKAIADKTGIPTSLVKGSGKIYWNEVALFDFGSRANTLKFYVVDLMNNIGNLLVIGSKAANQYCNLQA